MCIRDRAIHLAQSKPTLVNYVLGDITKILPFENRSFDAVVISFLLVNILPLTARKQLISEIVRISKDRGIVWINEGLLSDDYAKRYVLSKPFLTENYDFFVFKEGISSSSIQTHQQLEQALKEERIARVAHHFSLEELKELFEKFDIIYEKQLETTSPNTGSTIKMVIFVFRLK